MRERRRKREGRGRTVEGGVGSLPFSPTDSFDCSGGGKRGTGGGSGIRRRGGLSDEDASSVSSGERGEVDLRPAGTSVDSESCSVWATSKARRRERRSCARERGRRPAKWSLRLGERLWGSPFSNPPVPASHALLSHSHIRDEGKEGITANRQRERGWVTTRNSQKKTQTRRMAEEGGWAEGANRDGWIDGCDRTESVWERV